MKIKNDADKRSPAVRLLLGSKPPLWVRFGNMMMLLLIIALSFVAWQVYTAYGV